MTIVNHACDRCIHTRPNIDGWKCACDAFPEGIPPKHMLGQDVTKLKECNKGMKFEEAKKQ